MNCTALATTSSSSTAIVVACGMSSGSIEGYAIAKDGGQNPALVFQIDFHEQSIKCLKWLMKRPDSDENVVAGNPKFLSAASADGKLTFYKMPL